MILATPTTTPVEDVAKALGTPPWFQLYAPAAWGPMEQMLRRVEAAGCPALVITVDNITGRNMETYKRVRRLETNCSDCHKVEPGSDLTSRPMFTGINMTGVAVPSATLNWEYVDKLRKATKLKILIKGMDTREDAHMCLEHGIDGILVSNHGGRATETGRATIDALSEIVAEVGNRIPVLVDSGFRRGTDVFKALALGARGVGIGRPYIWGLGAFGQPGVDRVLEILQGELKMIMANCGTPTLADITPAHVGRA
jgi:isopentenyl diphosphate isomerase/L-lactate dehydrogenase-like FMN-dependent dehydrogenase